MCVSQLLNMLWLLVLFGAIVVTSSQLHIADQFEYSGYNFVGQMPKFDKPLYTAKVEKDVVEIVDGPIVLQSCGLYPFLVRMTKDDVNYTTLGTTDYYYPQQNCSIASSFSLSQEELEYMENRLHNVYKVQASLQHYIVAETYVVALNTPKSTLLELDGEKYIVLNYINCIIMLTYVVVSLMIGVVVFAILLLQRYRRYKGYQMPKYV